MIGLGDKLNIDSLAGSGLTLIAVNENFPEKTASGQMEFSHLLQWEQDLTLF